MQDDVVRLRDQAARARRLAGLSTDVAIVADLMRYADQCETDALSLETARQTAKDQLSRF